MKNKIIIFFLFFGVILGFIGLNKYMNYSKNLEIQSSNKKSIEMTLVAYQTIINTHKIAADTHYNSLMQNHKAMNLLKKFKYETNKNEQTFLRGELFRLLNKKYKTLKKLGIRQFHFHTHKGESLLRFHRPPKNGDSLIDIRESIKLVNTELKPFYGFEGGKIFPGFRYVFPIILEKDHLGSIEFSIPFEVIEQELQSVLPKIGYQLHLNKNISYDKVFNSLKEFFVPSPLLKNHYIENTTISAVENKLDDNPLVKDIQTQVKQIISNSADEFMNKENFSINSINKKQAFNTDFITIKSYYGVSLAHLVSYSKFDELIDIEQKYFNFKTLILIATLIILALLYIVFRQINKILTKNKSIQYLLDHQDNIVILTNGKEINFANLKFFDFFGFKDLEDFKIHHKCICEFFSENEKFFHLGKVKDNENWIDVIQSLPHSQRIVSMLSEDFKIHAFSVSISKFDDNFIIMSFTDISETMLEYIQLQEKIILDTLTSAFNREYFEQNYEKLLSKYHTKSTLLALAMIDIDYFKKVNDTYGHDIGDNVLVHFVNTIQKYSREDDILIRWGGEEFILVLKVSSEKSLVKALEHIRRVIEIENFPTIGKKTCSIGGTIYINNEDINKTIKRADEGVYDAKSNGRNQVVIK